MLHDDPPAASRGSLRLKRIYLRCGCKVSVRGFSARNSVAPILVDRCGHDRQPPSPAYMSPRHVRGRAHLGHRVTPSRCPFFLIGWYKSVLPERCPPLARFQSMKQVNYSAEHWRERAKEARAQAEQMSPPAAKRQLMEIAEAYEELAKLAAAQPLHEKPRST